ncbi:MAG: hypothetical protein CMJ48_13740 [Planctomycetaceae bacterium]|nr:hypothetical protein [Planctomycetaceae bacterium]
MHVEPDEDVLSFKDYPIRRVSLATLGLNGLIIAIANGLFLGAPRTYATKQVGRNKVAHHVAGTAQTHSDGIAPRRQRHSGKATAVPAGAAFARSGQPTRG